MVSLGPSSWTSRATTEGRTRCVLVPELREQGASEYRQIFVGAYRLIYDIQPESIDILAVMDGRRDALTILFQRLLR